MKFPIYLDYSATTPVDPRVAQKMIPFLTEQFGNPASRSHAFGWEAEKAVEEARAHVAALLNADPKEIIWTSGATEGNNLAIKGAANFYKGKGKHIVTMKTEHKAVLGLHRDDVFALALVEIRRALDGEVVAFGGAGSPDDLLGVGVEERRDVRARLLHRLLRFPTERVRAARRVAELLGEEGDHLLRHARVHRRGRGIVEVDRKFHVRARPAQGDTAVSLPRLS